MGLLEDAEDRAIAIAARRPLAPDDIGERGNTNRTSGEVHRGGAIAHALERSQPVHGRHEVHMQPVVLARERIENGIASTACVGGRRQLDVDAECFLQRRLQWPGRACRCRACRLTPPGSERRLLQTGDQEAL